MKRVITEEVVADELAAGRRHIVAPPSSTVVTPAAWSRARELGVSIDSGGPGAKPSPARPSRPKTAPEAGTAERSVDKSGVVVVRGKSVRLGAFAGAAPDKNVGLLDVITANDGAPMTAGIMSWSREDSFPWSLAYDEIDLVLEGVLRIEIDGRAIEGRAGDILYIPKGSTIVFATPSRVRVFYVTYPADWSSVPPQSVRAGTPQAPAASRR